MSKTVSFFLVPVILLAALIPASAQRSARIAKPVSSAPPAASGFAESNAFSDGRGVVVRWQMEVETKDVGFNVYRIGKGGQILANDGMILGSKAHFGDRTVFGESYFYYDVNGTIGDFYVVESIDASGSRVSSAKFGVYYTSDIGKAAGISVEKLRARDERRKAVLSNAVLTPPKEIRSEVRSFSSTPDITVQQSIAAIPGAKIGVRTDGFYRVTKAQLQAAGFDISSDPNTWQLFCDGVEQSILVAPNGNYIEFLGKAHETIESDLRYYFLTSGVATGKRMGTSISRSVGSPAMSANYQQTFFAKQRTNYINTILNGDAENYWGNVITSTTSTYTFNLSGVDTGAASASVLVKLQGFSSTPHSVGLTLNGQPLPTAIGSDPLPFSATGNVPASHLLEGLNTLSMTSGDSSDFSLFDSISISFNRKFLADQNQIPFYTLNYRGARITGFSSPNIRIFDTTNNGDPVQVLNLNIVPNGPLYDVILPANRGRTLYAVEDSAIMSSPSVIFNSPSNLASTAHNANLVIITYGDFISQARVWERYRVRQGFKVEVVDVADVFDEFNYGQSSSASIKAFLQYAVNNWQTPPQYVLLLGRASYDPKNYEGQGYLNFVPSMIVTTVFGETPSDDALVDFSGTGLANLPIGRIPASTGQAVSNALGKVQAFETPALQNLNRGAIFAYDLPIGYDFAGMSATLRSNLPSNMTAVMVDRGAANSATTLVNEINNGRYIVNYSGHGALGLWGSSSFFTSFSVPSLTNANNQSIFTMLTCLNGYFINPYADGLAQVLLNAQNGGSVVSWASTGETTPDVQLIMGNRFFNQIAAGNITRMGDLVRDAKSVIPASPDVLYSWVLLGDPMLKVR